MTLFVSILSKFGNLYMKLISGTHLRFSVSIKNLLCPFNLVASFFCSFLPPGGVSEWGSCDSHFGHPCERI